MNGLRPVYMQSRSFAPIFDRCPSAWCSGERTVSGRYIFVVNVLIIPVYTVGFAYVRFNNTDVFDAQFVSNIILLMYLFRTVCSILKKYLLIKDNKKTLKSPEKNKINQESAKTGHFDSKRINQCYPEKTVQLSPYLNFELWTLNYASSYLTTDHWSLTTDHWPLN